MVLKDKSFKGHLFDLLLIFRDAKQEKREINDRLKHAFKMTGANRCTKLQEEGEKEKRYYKNVERPGLKNKEALFYLFTVISLISMSSEWAD